MPEIVVDVKIKHGCEDIPLPQYHTNGSSGMDLMAAVEQDVKIFPGSIELIPTGLFISIPEGYEGQVRPRSGLALKYGIGVLNSPGTIDSDYRGEIRVILFNFGKELFMIKRGDRIAQLVISKYEKVSFNLRKELDQSNRDSGGFGSTGR